MKPEKNSQSSGLGCLILFALPFAGTGTFMAYLLLSSLWSHAAMLNWQEVPVRILNVSLEEERDDSTTYRVAAQYSYRFGGQEFIGRRVGLHGGSDNLGDWQRRTYGELRAHRDSGRPFRGYLDPDAPQESILYRDIRWEQLGLYALAALLFGGVGYGLVVLGFVGNKSRRRENHLKTRYAEQPWRHREDWAEGEVRSTARPALIFSMVFAVFWNLVSLPIVFLVPGEVLENGNRLAVIGLIFPAIGVGLLAWALRNLIRWRKFGRSRLLLDTLPGVVGGPLAGTIYTGSELRPEKGFTLTLDGVARRVTRSGGKRRTREELLHQESRHVPLAYTGMDMTETTVPVRFTIPFEAPPTSNGDLNNRVFWRLSIAAEVPGVDYASSFEVPVFRTADSSPEFVAAPATVSDRAGEEDLLDRGGLSMYREGDALIFHLAAARNKGAALGLTAFLGIWCGFIALMITLNAPWFFPIVFGLFALLMAIGVLDLWCGATRIEVRPGELNRRGGLFGLGRRRTWRAGEIDRLQVEKGMQAGRKLFYRLELVPGSGRPCTVAARLDSRAQAEALSRRIEEILHP